MSVPFAPQPGISGIFGRMESAPGDFFRCAPSAENLLRIFKTDSVQSSSNTCKNYLLRVRFFKKIQDWILKSERIREWILRFFTRQINPRSFGSLCIKGTEESSLEVDSSVPPRGWQRGDRYPVSRTNFNKIHASRFESVIVGETSGKRNFHDQTRIIHESRIPHEINHASHAFRYSRITFLFK